MDELLSTDMAVAQKDRLYRCLDRLLDYKDALCQFLTERWKTRFDAQFDVLLYDLTSTYFEGSGAEIPKAVHGYSRDGRPDCRQVVIALVVTADGLPLACEVLSGNTADKTTLRAFLGYCLMVTLRMKLRRAAPGLAPRVVLQSLAAIQMVDAHIPTMGRASAHSAAGHRVRAAAADDPEEAQVDAAVTAPTAYPRGANGAAAGPSNVIL